jgi:4-alpha-glucanotransferase
MPSQSIVITGNQPQLGNWQPEKSPIMNCIRLQQWKIALDASKLIGSVEYKFCVVDTETRRPILWEDGENRILPAIPDKQFFSIEVEPAIRIKPVNTRIAGTVIPVFSLRTKKSFGIGDFGDLIPCIDWLAMTGQHILQLLPINDTTKDHTWKDSYPYNAISINALNPLYLNLKKLGILRHSGRRALYSMAKKRLNSLPEIDYNKVDFYKWKYFQEIFNQDGKKTLQSIEYSYFYKENQEWLIPYASFSAKRDGKDKNLYLYLQFHLHRQLSQAVYYAHSKRVLIKGDVPVGVSRKGIDVKMDRKLFNTYFNTGAPPDAFSETGQNWGFPTYNWNVMESDGYSWFKKRFINLGKYFDAYRIDHILGFFRIWEIPTRYTLGIFGNFYPAIPYSEKEILATGFPFKKDIHTKIQRLNEDSKLLFVSDQRQSGYYHPAINARQSSIYKTLDEQSKQQFDCLYDEYFYHRNNELWSKKGKEKLQAITMSTDMLPCGEDLGMIPDCVPEIMRELNILSLEIERMSKHSGRLFTDINNLPYLSVCTTSTHDMNTLRLWWKENTALTQQYYNNILGRSGEAPAECTDDICEQIIANHLNSNSMLAILPLQDWLSIDNTVRRINDAEERINIPSNPDNRWRYSMHLSFEELHQATALNEKIRRLVIKSERQIE